MTKREPIVKNGRPGRVPASGPLRENSRNSAPTIDRERMNKEARAIIQVLKELKKNDQHANLMSYPEILLPLLNRLHDLALLDVALFHVTEESMGNETASELEQG